MLNDGILYCYNNEEVEGVQIVVPAHERTKILATYQDDATAGQYGSERNIARIVSRYFWPVMRSDITSYVRKCIECQRFKASNTKPIGQTDHVHWYKLTSMDFNVYLLPKMYLVAGSRYFHFKKPQQKRVPKY